MTTYIIYIYIYIALYNKPQWHQEVIRVFLTTENSVQVAVHEHTVTWLIQLFCWIMGKTLANNFNRAVAISFESAMATVLPH